LRIAEKMRNLLVAFGEGDQLVAYRFFHAAPFG
jgi:hypothetical protein